VSHIVDTIGNPQPLVSALNTLLDEAGIKRTKLAMLDHIAYRVETFERYEELMQQLSKLAILRGVTEVAGRPIATFEFHDYLEVEGWTIPCLELPAPKKESPYPEGLEHAEFVVIGSLRAFIARHNDLPFDTKAMNKTLNPELGLKVSGCSVKFHEAQLGAIVGIEERLDSTD
jgi:uncharacterized protein